MSNILYISNVKPPFDECSSTDIMTNSIIHGLSQTSNSITLLLLIDDIDEKKKLNDYYSKLVDRVLFSKRFFHEGQSKYRFLFGGLVALVLQKSYRTELSCIIDKLGHIDTIIANKVTIDEIIYAELINKEYPQVKSYQFWSDPMALSGITSNMFYKMPRRWLFRILEKKLISRCDLVIYGTRTLYHTQSAFYKSLSGKMRYIDICYTPSKNTSNCIEGNRLLYAGNYYSSIRDITPLAEAISLQNKYTLDIYGNGDVDLSNYKNVEVHSRVDRETLEKIEAQHSAIICVLNKTASQIPGKIFYDMCSDKAIIVLTDGTYSETILEDLESYHRFKVCKNTCQDILNMLSKDLSNIEFDIGEIKTKYSPLAISMSLLNGGKTESR